MQKIATFVLAAVLTFAVAAPAFAAGNNGAGREFGQHHASHAREMGGFSGDMNPGKMHHGFSGWMGV